MVTNFMASERNPRREDAEIWRARAQLMADRAKEESEFLDAHPEFAYTLAALTGTVCSCPKSGLSLANLELEPARRHLDECGWCQYNYELAAKQQLTNMSSL
jgi:hypothetical protein